jgi:hypothetical protein
MADTKTWPTTKAKGGPTGTRRRGRPRVTTKPNPIYSMPSHKFYAILIYRLLLASIIATVFIVGMLTSKGS